MKNSRLCKVLSKRHIPADLWPEILSRLPVKSLLRFRCVSRSWLSLIDNAEFARLHLNNFNNNRDETHLLVVHGRQQNCVVRCSGTFEINSGMLHTLGNEYNRDGKWDIVFSVDGLIVLRHDTGTGTFHDLKVWNPSIRKFSELPSLPKIRTSPNIYMIDVDIGLGYDPLANDYKLVKLIFLNFETLHSVAIYSLGGGSWKTIEFQGKGSSCSNWRWGFVCPGSSRSVYFQGSLYFIARDAHKDCVRDLVTFDLSSEVFSSISMPDNPYGFTGCNQLTLIDGGGSLATFDTSPTSVDKSLWVLGSESMKWTKRAEFRLKCIQLLYLKKNGDILIRRGRGETLTDETGKKKVVRWDQVISYSPGTDEYKIVQERRGSFYVISHVCGYVQSLILHK